MAEKVKIDPRYFDLIDDVTRWYKNYLQGEKEYLETGERRKQVEINQINMNQAVMNQIENRWLKASPDGEGYQLSRGEICYLKDTVETGITNRNICPLETEKLQELFKYLESLLF